MKKSFDLGVYISLILAPLSLLTLAYTVLSLYSKDQGSPGSGKGVEVEILVPGITLPINEIGFYVATLLISSVFHEIGHAIASVLEDVPLIGFGIRFYFIIPMAYTEIGTEAMEKLRYWSKLRILCAGVWHNLVLGLISYLILIQIPAFASLLYSTGSGLYILEIEKQSPIYGPKGLQNEDIIEMINRVRVTDENSYFDALIETLKNKPKYCVSSDFVHTHDESVNVETVKDRVECCDRNNFENLCFEHFIVNGMLEMPPFMCLNIRRMIEHSVGYCDEQDNCNSGFYCIKPLLDNRTTLIQVHRKAQREVIYLGNPGDIYKTVKMSKFIPKTSLFSSRLAENVTLFFKYLTVFSFGLVFVNILPCYGFDGQFITSVLTLQFLDKTIRRRKNRHAVSMAITIIGTILLFVVVLDFVRQNVVSVFY